MVIHTLVSLWVELHSYNTIFILFGFHHKYITYLLLLPHGKDQGRIFFWYHTLSKIQFILFAFIPFHLHMLCWVPIHLCISCPVSFHRILLICSLSFLSHVSVCIMILITLVMHFLYHTGTLCSDVGLLFGCGYPYITVPDRLRRLYSYNRKIHFSRSARYAFGVVRKSEFTNFLLCIFVISYFLNMHKCMYWSWLV